ncbi:MAG: alpha/beta hydrolase fold domain-containing protein, partial [Clostridia bacterium]|nr:alpha/beta hydrolase fold domain-containing protein [Clostridia bacterium]
MNKKLYLRSLAAQGWYNFTEGLVYMLVTRPTPENLIYEKKLKYGTDNLQYINTYCKKGTENQKKPLFIYIHGGGWLSGITEMRNRYAALWAEKGYFTASVSYNYAPQKTFPAPIQDC